MYLSTNSENVVKCSRCGFVFLASGVNFDKLKELYTKDYFLERKEYFYNDGICDASGIESKHIKDFRDGLKWIEFYKKPPGKLLDIGCATGSFLSLAQEKKWICYGVEISEYAAAAAKKKSGIQIFNGEFTDASYPNGYFDVVTMWDFLEHIPDPLKTLRKVRCLLKDTGILLVNAPNEDSLIRVIARGLYHLTFRKMKLPVNKLYHCYHLNCFNITTLTLFLEKAGFEIIAKRKKVMPITRGRSSTYVRGIRKILSFAEKCFHSEYEMFFIVQRSD